MESTCEITLYIQKLCQQVLSVVKKIKDKGVVSLCTAVYDALYDAVYNAVRLIVRASKAVPSVVRASDVVLRRTVTELLDSPTAKEACQKVFEFCIAELNRVDVTISVVKSFVAAEMTKRAVAAAQLAVAAAQLAEQSAAIAGGSIKIVEINQMATATKAFSNTLLSSAVLGTFFFTCSVIYSYYQVQNEQKTQEEHKKYVTTRATGTVGSIAGASAGAFVGTLLLPVPGVGTVVGGFFGGLLGNLVGSATGAGVYDEMSAPKKE